MVNWGICIDAQQISTDKQDNKQTNQNVSADKRHRDWRAALPEPIHNKDNLWWQRKQKEE